MVDGTDVTRFGGAHCRGTGDALTGVMGTTGTSAGAVLLADLGCATFIVAGGVGFGVVPLELGTLRV